MPTIRQTLPGAVQFNGVAGSGLFDIGKILSAVPRTTRVIINNVTYYEAWDNGAALTTNFYAEFRLPGGGDSERSIIDRALASGMTSPITGNIEARFCGAPLPREPGESGGQAPVVEPGRFWAVHCFTQNKRLDGTVCVDYTLCPFPDTTPQDSSR